VSIENVDRRRTDTRSKARDVALDLFAERGYEQTTLAEIAQRLGITRAALYYHYTGKDDLLLDIHRYLAEAVDDLIAWAESQPRGGGLRGELLRRVAVLLNGPWGKFTHFAQTNEAAMCELPAISEFHARTDRLAELLSADASVTSRMRARLALGALFMAGPRAAQLGGTQRQREKAALEVAAELLGA
jgi:AcrR family transcriptional regulator